MKRLYKIASISHLPRKQHTVLCSDYLLLSLPRPKNQQTKSLPIWRLHFEKGVPKTLAHRMIWKFLLLQTRTTLCDIIINMCINHKTHVTASIKIYPKCPLACQVNRSKNRKWKSPSHRIQFDAMITISNICWCKNAKRLKLKYGKLTNDLGVFTILRWRWAKTSSKSGKQKLKCLGDKRKYCRKF